MQKGFTPILIILGIILLLGIAGGTYYFGKLPIKHADNNPKACTQETKICSDGSSVGRTGPNCEFAKCPTAAPKAFEEMVNWKTYENGEFMFSLKYPDKYPDNWNPPSGFEPAHLGKGLRFSLGNYDNMHNNFDASTISVIITDESLETVKQYIQKDYGGTGSNQKRGSLEGIFYTGIDKIEDFRGNVLGDQFKADFIFSNGEWIYWFGLRTDPAKKNEHLQLFNQILSTFKFLDQKEPAIEGKFCGGFAGKLCPTGYSCKLDGNYPDAGGKCVKD